MAPSVRTCACAYTAANALKDLYEQLLREPSPNRWHVGLLGDVGDLAETLEHVASSMAYERRSSDASKMSRGHYL